MTANRSKRSEGQRCWLAATRPSSSGVTVARQFGSARAPSPIREPAHRSFPKQAEDWDLARLVKAYAAAAARMQAAGLDGIELEAYGPLMDGFWSPATNRRTDDYGGSLDNRLRFTFEVLDAIRAAVGPEFIVGLRMVVDEAWGAHLHFSDRLPASALDRGADLVLARGRAEVVQGPDAAAQGDLPPAPLSGADAGTTPAGRSSRILIGSRRSLMAATTSFSLQPPLIRRAKLRSSPGPNRSIISRPPRRERN